MLHWIRKSLLLLAALVLAALSTLALTRNAYAAPGDVIENWDQNYVVNTDGSVVVSETLTYRFGSPASSHGITRRLTVREPYRPDTSKDRIYRISNINVTADKPVSTSVKQLEEDTASNGAKTGRDRGLSLRIGDANKTVSHDVVTYTLRYTIQGAIISPKDGDEFFWDVVPMGSAVPSVKALTVTVDMVSSPLLQTKCKFGSSGSSQDCPATSNGKTATFTAHDVGAGSGVTVSAIQPEGAISNNQPILENRADRPNPIGILVAGIGTVITSIGAAIAAVLWKRKNGTDQRFLGLPPGLVPAGGEVGNIGRDNKPKIPVSFVPPKITVGEAGLLADAKVDVRDTTATLVSLATKGALKIANDPQTRQTTVMLVDPSVVTEPHEKIMLDLIFGDSAVGDQVDLSTQGSMAVVHSHVTDSLLTQVGEKGFYNRMPRALGKTGCGTFLMFGFGAFFILPGLFGFVAGIGLFLLPVIPIAIGFIAVGIMRAKGQRSAMGRAITDQIEGFRTYLATAEARQIAFEEGEDIFSKYLPWAIMFGLAERWTKICQQLVQMGVLPDAQPDWYFGPWYGFGYFDIGGLDSSLSNAATIPTPTTDASSGSGDSSWGSFDVGGGGGGGDIGSW